VKAVVESIGQVGSRTRVGDHELIFDQPGSVPGGEDRGPSPLDVLAAYLHGRGLPTDELTVEVTTEKARVPVSRIGRLALQVTLPSGLSEKQFEGVERAIKSCPAYGTLLHPPEVEVALDSAGDGHPDAERAAVG